jgi:hypothetical protein
MNYNFLRVHGMTLHWIPTPLLKAIGKAYKVLSYSAPNGSTNVPSSPAPSNRKGLDNVDNEKEDSKDHDLRLVVPEAE